MDCKKGCIIGPLAMLLVSISTFYYCYMNTINRPCNRRIDEIELGYF